MLRNKMYAVLFGLLAVALFGASVSRAETIITNTGYVDYTNEAGLQQAAAQSATVFTKYANPALAVLKTRDVGKGPQGTVVTYTIKITYPRIGTSCGDDSVAKNIIFDDTVPAGMTFNTGTLRRNWAGGGWTVLADPAGTLITVPVPDMNEGDGDAACTAANENLIEFKVTVGP